MKKNELKNTDNVALCIRVIRVFSSYFTNLFDLNEILFLESETNWNKGHFVFQKVRKATNQATSVKDETYLCMLENGCKVIYNASFPVDPFDSDSLEWFIHCAKLLPSHLGNSSLNKDLHSIIDSYYSA